jgi:hypothetical protein
MFICGPTRGGGGGGGEDSGISLLIFCMPQDPRRCVKELFYEIICQKKVPDNIVGE